MSILGSSDDGPETPEEKIIEEEESVVESLENIQESLINVTQSEERLEKALEKGLPENQIESRIGDIEIYLEEEINPRLQSVAQELQDLENYEGKFKDEVLIREHVELMQLLKRIIPEIRNEAERLENIVEYMQGSLEQEFSHQEALSELREKLKTEESEARNLKEEIEEAEELEQEIRRDEERNS